MNKQKLIASITYLAALTAAVIIVLSASINGQYGLLISKTFAAFFVALGAAEIFLPLMAIFCSPKIRKIAHIWCVVIVSLSVLTALSALSTSRGAAESAVKGYDQDLASARAQLAAAESAYSAAAANAAAASQKLARETAKDGYIKRAQQVFDNAQSGKQRAYAELQAAQSKVSSSRSYVHADSDNLFVTLAKLTGVSMEAWRNIVNVFTSLVFAVTGFVMFLVISDVGKLHLSPQPKPQQKPMATPAPVPVTAASKPTLVSSSEGKKKEP